MNLRAFAVTEEFENTGEVIFAKSYIEARRWGADALNDGELGGLSVRRATWADRFAPGPIPKLEQIAHGWRWECDGCYAVIDDSGEIWRDDICIELAPVEGPDGLFCSTSCRSHHHYSKQRADRIKTGVLRWLKRELVKRMPGAVLDPEGRWPDHHVHIDYRDGRQSFAKEAEIYFRFPGCAVGAATFGFKDKPSDLQCRVCSGDLPAFEAWKAAGYPMEMPS